MKGGTGANHQNWFQGNTGTTAIKLQYWQLFPNYATTATTSICRCLLILQTLQSLTCTTSGNLASRQRSQNLLSMHVQWWTCEIVACPWPCNSRGQCKSVFYGLSNHKFWVMFTISWPYNHFKMLLYQIYHSGFKLHVFKTPEKSTAKVVWIGM